MTDSELLDSTVWLEYLIKGSFKEKIEQEDIFALSPISLFEIKKILLKNKKLMKKEIEGKINFVKSKSIIINIDDKIAEKASEISEERDLGAADALIYTTGILNNAVLFTLDNDFRGLSNVKIL